MHRRSFVAQSLLGTLIAPTTSRAIAKGIESWGLSDSLPPIRRITQGPKFHWRGYYDKWLFDGTNRYVVANEVDFEHRTPEADDSVTVGMIDLQDRDRWIPLGTSRAWNWQQGCMLQWVPGEGPSRVLWNDREDGRFVSYLLEVETGKRTTLSMPIYCIAPDGRWGLSVDFRRLNDCRPGYGYAGIADPFAEHPAPSQTGIWKVDFITGKSQLLLSYEQIAAMEYDREAKFAFDPKKSKHWFNHLLINPAGDRFLFLHRWREVPAGATRDKIAKTGFATRMITCNPDGTDPFVVDPLGKTSHFVWRDATSICAWAYHPSFRDRFYLFHDRSRKVEAVGPNGMTQNGHNTYVPTTKQEWILNDTYPDKGRQQHPYLYHVPSDRRVELAHLLSPEVYTGEWRCDNHPSASRDGKWAVVDSTHEGLGRQVYLIDIDAIVHEGI